MDPTQCYKELLQALMEQDDELALERATDLRQWLRIGGFAPMGYSTEEVGDTLLRLLDE